MRKRETTPRKTPASERKLNLVKSITARQKAAKDHNSRIGKVSREPSMPKLPPFKDE